MNEWIAKMQHVCKNVISLDYKKDDILSDAKTWIKLEGVMRSQKKKKPEGGRQIPNDSSPMWEQTKSNETNHKFSFRTEFNDEDMGVEKVEVSH